MTKKKTGSFQGAWLNTWITGSAPIPEFLNAQDREKLERNLADAENKERKNLARILARARVKNGEFNSSAAAMRDEAGFLVLTIVLEQLADWRFKAQRIAEEPEPREWQCLIRQVKVPERPSASEFAALFLQVGRLPLRVLGELDLQLYRAHKIGRVELLKRLGNHGDVEDAKILRDTLGQMADALSFVTGKRGPKNDKGTHLRVVADALQQHCEFKKRPDARLVAAELLRAAGIPISNTRQRLVELDKDAAVNKGKL